MNEQPLLSSPPSETSSEPELPLHKRSSPGSVGNGDENDKEVCQDQLLNSVKYAMSRSPRSNGGGDLRS